MREIELSLESENYYFFKVKGKYSRIESVIIWRDCDKWSCTCVWGSIYGVNKRECWHAKDARKWLKGHQVILKKTS